MPDETEPIRHQMEQEIETIRHQMVQEINANPSEREKLESEHGQVWTTRELGNDFDVIGFLAPLVVVVRKSDKQKGSLLFQHSPRFYFHFQPYLKD